MVLGFKKEFPWGGPTYFKEKILIGAGYGPPHPPKIHTIRAGNRWKPGMQLHMANGVRTENYEQFNTGIQCLEKVVSVQDIKFRHYDWTPAGLHPKIRNVQRLKFELMIVTIDGKKFGPEFINTLAINDGFSDLLDFHKWFWPLKNFEGQIIHWTDFQYK